MSKVGILIDFDNIFPRPINEYQLADLKRVIEFSINSLKATIPSIDRFCVRLYGGWYENNSFTARASALSSMLPALNTVFPILVQPSTIIQGSIELATQLYGHSFVWYNTYREHAGLPKLRIDQSVLSAQCGNNPNTCPVKILK